MFDSYEEIFARRADRYEAAMAAFPRARDAEFEAVVASVPPDARAIFDMPAGAGYLRAYLPAGRRYVAIEPAAYFFERCPSDESAERIQSPVEHVPCADGIADAVVSLAGLHHAPDLAAVFREFQRVLRPDGTLIVADVSEGSRPGQFLNGYVHANSPMGHVGHFLGADTVPLLDAAGFTVLSDEELPVPWRFAGADEAGAYGASLFGIEGPGVGDVADALRDLVGMSRDAGGIRVDWTLRRLVCRAR